MVFEPDVYINLNIFETTNPTRISNRSSFLVISQAKFLVSSTFWLKLIFTELFDTTRGFWILTCTFLNIFETINPPLISNRGKFMIISQANLLVPSTFWLEFIFTELFETARGFWIETCTLISISSKLTNWSFHKLNAYGVIWHNKTGT